GRPHLGDLGHVLRLALVVLLPVGVADRRVGLHDDPGQRPVDPGLPRALGALDLAVLVVLGVLAHVPDVAVAVLGVPVVGVLGDLVVHAHGVAHHHDRDPHDDLLLVGHLDHVVLGLPLVS